MKLVIEHTSHEMRDAYVDSVRQSNHAEAARILLIARGNRDKSRLEVSRYPPIRSCDTCPFFTKRTFPETLSDHRLTVTRDAMRAVSAFTHYFINPELCDQSAVVRMLLGTAVAFRRLMETHIVQHPVQTGIAVLCLMFKSAVVDVFGPLSVSQFFTAGMAAGYRGVPSCMLTGLKTAVSNTKDPDETHEALIVATWRALEFDVHTPTKTIDEYMETQGDSVCCVHYKRVIGVLAAHPSRITVNATRERLFFAAHDNRLLDPLLNDLHECKPGECCMHNGSDLV
jgi:hypothetical protein